MAKDNAEPTGFGASLMGLSGLFKNAGGMKNSDVSAREAEERRAIKTEKQRELTRGRTRSTQINIRCTPVSVDRLAALAVTLGITKTDVFDLALKTLADKHGVK